MIYNLHNDNERNPMPNWVFNTLTIQGNKSEVDYIKNRLNAPFTMEHKSWNPKTHTLELATSTYSNPVFSFWNITRPEDLEAYNTTPEHTPGETISKMFSGNDWYSWNVRNWGTKWDVAVGDSNEYPDTVLVEHKSEGEDQWLVYKFDTAWSPPVSALESLSELVPNCVVTLDWQEEQGFGGQIEFVRGDITAESDYESRCYDCDAIDTMEYCENDCGQICSKCNNLGEADLDCVAECQDHKIYLETNVPDYRKADL